MKTLKIKENEKLSLGSEKRERKLRNKKKISTFMKTILFTNLIFTTTLIIHLYL